MTFPLDGYTRMKGASREFLSVVGGTHTLWKNSDTLATVKSTSFSESCRRFPLRDIQAIVCTESRALRIAHLILSVLGLLYIALVVILTYYLLSDGILGPDISTSDPFVLISMALLTLPGVFLLLGVLASILKGPTCEVRIVTAVQDHTVRALSRWRTARKVLPEIIEMIQQAQGTLDQDNATDALIKRALVSEPAGRKPIKAVAPPTGLVRLADKGWLHLAMFILLLCDIPICLTDLLSNSPLAEAANTLSGFAVVVVAITCLMTQNRSRLPASLKIMVWAVLAAMFALFMFGSGIAVVVMTAGDPDLGLTTSDLPLEVRWYLVSANVLMDSFLGAFGIALLVSFYRGRRSAAPQGEEG